MTFALLHIDDMPVIQDNILSLAHWFYNWSLQPVGYCPQIAYIKYVY